MNDEYIKIDENDINIETYFNDESTNFIAPDKLFTDIDNWLFEMDKLLENE